MPMMINADSLLPYLESMQRTRVARSAIPLPTQPHTTAQQAKYDAALAKADRAYTEACEILALQLAYIVEQMVPDQT
jgi:hypothetical protein